MAAEQKTTRPDTAEITANGPCNGMGRPDAAGSYINICIETRSSVTRHRISRGAAEVLLAELQGVLANAR